jgi:hypothetical protein
MIHQEKGVMPIYSGIKHATAHHELNVIDQSREKIDANSQISVCCYHPVNNKESDHVNKVDENVG